MGSGPAQQAVLSEGCDSANQPNQIFELNLFIKKNVAMGNSIYFQLSFTESLDYNSCRDNEVFHSKMTEVFFT